jgi:hypothetical protein
MSKALKIIFNYADGDITVVRQQYYETTMPFHTAIEDAVGYHVVSLNADDEVLHRVRHPGIFATGQETRYNGVHSWTDVTTTSGSFTVSIPAHDDLENIAIVEHKTPEAPQPELEAALFAQPVEKTEVCRFPIAPHVKQAILTPPTPDTPSTPSTETKP